MEILTREIADYPTHGWSIALGDQFTTLSIALDRPFVIGDFLMIDCYLGNVEYVGLKTTPCGGTLARAPQCRTLPLRQPPGCKSP